MSIRASSTYNSVEWSSHSTGATSTLMTISGHLFEDSSPSSFLSSSSRDGLKERLRIVGEQHASSTVSDHYPLWTCSENDAHAIELAAQCSKAVYDETERPLVSAHSSVKRVYHLQPSLDGSTKVTAVYVVERMSLEGLLTTIIVAVRGSKGLSDWMVNANNRSERTSDFIDLDTLSELSSQPIESLSVHSGFLISARAIVPRILSKLRSIISAMDRTAHREIVFTGHSAGGAVAGLVYMHFLTKALSNYDYIEFQDIRLSCITFGSPPIFTISPQAILAAVPVGIFKPGLLLSIINDGDPVPRADSEYVRTLLNLLGPPDQRKVRLRPLVLHTIGTIVVLRDRNIDRTADEAPEDDLFAHELNRAQLANCLFVNFFAHHMDEYLEVARQMGKGHFNNGRGLTAQIYPSFTIDF